MWSAALFRPGLSPRVRGNRAFNTEVIERTGSIPAGAGEPPRDLFLGIGIKVYPRGCGGTASTSAVSGRARGLSPRVRGNPTQACLWNTSNRSIPAGAGEPRC